MHINNPTLIGGIKNSSSVYGLFYTLPIHSVTEVQICSWRLSDIIKEVFILS